MYEYFYDKVFPEAIRYGMTENQFWHGDMRLLEVYQKAYFTNASFVAWQQGYYNNVAYSIVMSNAFAKKGSKPKEYPEWENPMDKLIPRKDKDIDIETEFRNQQIKQNAWLFHR